MRLINAPQPLTPPILCALNLTSEGKTDVDHLLSLVDDKTSLVSVIHVNNETGAINNIFDIAKRVKAKNKYTLFHSDGVQAYGKVPFRLTSDIDLYSVSAHKIGGVKGCDSLSSPDIIVVFICSTLLKLFFI